MNCEIEIRMAKETDAEKILEIYRYYVENTAISFEYATPTEEEFADRIKQILTRYPYFVAVEKNEIVGYAYASPLKTREAFDWAVETTIYLAPDSKGKGIGRMLYNALENRLKKQNVINLNACIAYTNTEDSHLTNASMHFHEHLGYKEIGHFTKCGYKFDKWYDIVWMEKMIQKHPNRPEVFIPITDLQ